ncbi:hypothetical protein LVD15_06210 [Fulvivirga maritima]|uniref:hypothetical protein n=1 Tax=Fulvivirga maritima TaxID=2904247 RepID=UPI001F2CFC67|nr:hypothetical protein [Fulvivirga maritima]UII28015.1 hypothetical protein LVD15_06210 [Fulvivirga maritima]
MQDQLKNAVQNRRQEFDVYQTDYDAVWGNIDKGLRKTRRINLWQNIGKMAAAVLLLCVAGVVTLQFAGGDYKQGYALHDVSPEMAETEFYYSQQVAEKLQVIKASNTNIDHEVMQNLSMLDSAYAELKNDLKDNADSEEVIDAMIANYRIKLQILEQIIGEIRKHKGESIDEDVNI